MTPRGQLDERCFTDWLHGLVIIASWSAAIIFLVLAFTVSVFAKVPSNVQAPPARYNHSFQGRLQVQEVTRPWLVYLCGPMAQACAPVGGERKGVCTITLPKIGTRFIEGRVDLEGWKALYRHERAHCNGWGANHPR